MTFISYSQNSEDVLLWRALGHVQNGFYIDVGANDPEEHSVTKAFYDAGWRGISIEPLPSFHQAFVEQRPRDVNLAIAAGSSDGELTLYDTPQVRGWASPEKSVAELHRSEGHDVVELTVPVRTLASVCEEHVRGEIHFLKIDVEGFEGEVLKGMDFTRWRPWVLVIEATLPNSRETRHEEWDALVTGQRYRYVWFDGLNRYYVAEEHAELGAHFGIQPNVFDDYISHHLDKAWAAAERLTEALRASEIHAGEVSSAAEAAALQSAAQHTEMAAQADQLRKDLHYALVRTDAAEQERRLAEQERREAELARRQAEHDRREAENERRLAERNSAAAEQGRLEAEKAMLVAEHAMEHALAEAAATVRQAQQEAAEVAQAALHQAHQAEQMRLEAMTECAALREALAASQNSSHQLNHWARSLEQQLMATHASTSWRLTRPLRGAGLLLRALRRPDLARRVLTRITANERLRRLLIPVLLRYPRLGKRVTASISAIKQAAPAPMGAPEAAAAVAAVMDAVPEEFKGMPVSVRAAMADLRRARSAHTDS